MMSIGMENVECEEEMILGRLVAIRELRQTTYGLEGRGSGVPASDVVLPAAWVHLLGRGLVMAIKDVEEGCAVGERVERVRWLATAIRGVESGSAYSVSPAYHEALLAGLRRALGIQHFDAQRLSKHDPLGMRFIAWKSVYALYGFIEALEDSVDEASVEVKDE